MNQIFEDINDFEVKLGLPTGFYQNLIKEDDWSFVIKLSALFEAACTHILATKLRAPELESAFSYLEQANTKYGKIVLLKELGAINEYQYRFLNNLATLRNSLAHSIKNVSFTFDEYTKTLDKNQKKSFISSYAYNCNDEPELKGKKIPKDEFILSNAKEMIWFTASDILGCLYLEIEIVEFAKLKEGLEWCQKNLTSDCGVKTRN